MKNEITRIGFEARFKRIEDIKEYLAFIVKKYDDRNLAVTDCLIYPRKYQSEIPFSLDSQTLCRMNTDKASFEALKMEAYPDKASSAKIETYDDYKKSSCGLLLLIYDMFVIEIYCKDGDGLNELIFNASRYDLEYFDEKTEENDPRTRMSF